MKQTKKPLAGGQASGWWCGRRRGHRAGRSFWCRRFRLMHGCSCRSQSSGSRWGSAPGTSCWAFVLGGVVLVGLRRSAGSGWTAHAGPGDPSWSRPRRWPALSFWRWCGSAGGHSHPISFLMVPCCTGAVRTGWKVPTRSCWKWPGVPPAAGAAGEGHLAPGGAARVPAGVQRGAGHLLEERRGSGSHRPAGRQHR